MYLFCVFLAKGGGIDFVMIGSWQRNWFRKCLALGGGIELHSIPPPATGQSLRSKKRPDMKASFLSGLLLLLVIPAGFKPTTF